MDISLEQMQKIGFKLKSYPDRQFWVLEPDGDDNDLRMRLANALGFAPSEAEDIPDTLFVQANEDLSAWDVVCGGDVWNLDLQEAEEIIHELGTAS